jgi:hypothetical protein
LRAVIKRTLAIAAVVGVGAFFVWLNVQAPRVGINPLGELMAKVGHLGLFLFFWWAVYALGRGAERLLAGRRSWPPELAAALGVVAFVVAAFALCALGLAYGWLAKVLIVGAGAAGAVLLRKELGRLPARVKRWLEELDVDTAALVVGVAVIAFPVALTAAEPPYYWDALTYHLAVPKAYAEAHGFTYLRYNVYSSMPLGGSLFFLWPYLWDGLIAAKASNLVATVLFLSLTYRLARAWLGQFYAALAAAFVILTPVVFVLMAGAHADHFLILFTVSALYIYLRGRGADEVAGGRWAAAVGVFLGAAVAVKYSAAAVGAAFLPVLIYDAVKKKTRFAEVGIILGAAAVMVVPWLAKAYVERGNPVFPLAYGTFGGAGFTAEQARRLLAWQSGMGRGRGPLELLLLPYRISVEAGFSYRDFHGIYLPFLLPLAALAVFVFRRAGRLLAFGWFFLLAWAFGPQQLRFLGPALPAFATGAAGALAAVDPRRYVWPSRAWRVFVVGAVLALAFSYAAGPIFDALPGHAYLLGAMDGEGYLGHRCPYYRAQEFINDELPPDAKILMVGINQVLYMERPAIYDSFLEASAFLLAAEKAGGPEELYALARSWGVTHVFYYRLEEARMWPSYASRTRAVFYDFLSRHGAAVYEDDASRVYELVE